MKDWSADAPWMTGETERRRRRRGCGGGGDGGGSVSVSATASVHDIVSASVSVVVVGGGGGCGGGGGGCGDSGVGGSGSGSCGSADGRDSSSGAVAAVVVEWIGSPKDQLHCNRTTSHHRLLQLGRLELDVARAGTTTCRKACGTVAAGDFFLNAEWIACRQDSPVLPPLPEETLDNA